jgi:hypothetical protein
MALPTNQSLPVSPVPNVAAADGQPVELFTLNGSAVYTGDSVTVSGGTSSGTGGSGVDAVARSVAASAYAIAVDGTNAASGALDAAIIAQGFGLSAYGVGTAAQARADVAYVLAEVGTNTGTAAYTAAGVAQSRADAAFSVAVDGTNMASAAYAMAQIGTAIPNYTAGGTMTGALVVSNVVVGVGTLPVSSAVNGTLYYDFTGSAYQITTASSGFRLSAKNRRTGAEVCAVIVSNGVQQAITYDTVFSWFGTQVPYTSTTSGKSILVPLTCLNGDGTNVVGATSAQI